MSGLYPWILSSLFEINELRPVSERARISELWFSAKDLTDEKLVRRPLMLVFKLGLLLLVVEIGMIGGFWEKVKRTRLVSRSEISSN